MEWEPVFILGMTGGAMLISAIRSVIDRGRRDSAAEARRAAPAPRKSSQEIDDLKERLAVLEWIAAPAARTAGENRRLRRGAA